MTTIRTARDSRWGETFARLKAMTSEGRYEEVEAEARALAALPRRPWRRRPPHWEARVLATGAAVMHGRMAEALDELDALVAELEPVGLNSRMLRLIARSNRVVALSALRRYTEAETEANGVLRELNQIAHRAPVAALEINTLGHLAVVLCGLGRHEEAEAVARGNLPRAKGPAAGVLHTTLAHGLNGQGRYEEALAEVRRGTQPPPVTPAGTRTWSPPRPCTDWDAAPRRRTPYDGRWPTANGSCTRPIRAPARPAPCSPASPGRNRGVKPGE
ncbi:tetratricopeptide repeat protein [Streptomyces sp. CCM_MD2014]|uniref:tetratricopeptide repeat protein n=1 Tax=Streptomyces sp. CCM_MD2014 TaxID=1561022 RepID=UPI001F46D0A9|nr:tetratricopeptide repeat protein [Streptomyces sp. CCM_MD2014]